MDSGIAVVIAVLNSEAAQKEKYKLLNNNIYLQESFIHVRF